MNMRDVQNRNASSLNEILGRYCDHANDSTVNPPIKNIMLIGGLKDENSPEYGGLSGNDFSYLKETLEQLQKSGLKVDSDLKLI